MSQHASGWYDDPQDPARLRYWDGVTWTDHTTAKVAPARLQSQSPAPGATAPYTGQGQGQGGPGQQTAQEQPGWPGQGPNPARGPQDGAPGYPSYPGGPGAAYGAWPHTGPTTPDGVPLAGYGSRVGACLLDTLFTTVLTLLLSWVWVGRYIDYVSGLVDEASRGYVPDQDAMANQVLAIAWPIAVVALVVHLVYHVGFNTHGGQTLGMRICRIRVRRRDRPGSLSFVDALRRELLAVVTSAVNFLPIVSFVAGIVSLLDLLWPLWDGNRQALHDKIAGTNVVEAPPTQK